MGSNSYFAAGQYNFVCDLCGKQGKSSDARKTWDGFYVCSSHKEVRNPQDFVRGRGEQQALPWSRPVVADSFVSPIPPSTCTLRGTNGLAGFAVAGCGIPSKINLAFLPTESPSCTLNGLNGLAGYAVPGCSLPSYDNFTQIEGAI